MQGASLMEVGARSTFPRHRPGVRSLTFCIALLFLAAAESRGAAPAKPAVDLLSPDAAAALMKKVNAWQLANPYCGVPEELASNNDTWIRATWYTGVMAAYGATGDEGYLEQALRWSRMHEWKPAPESDGGANLLTCTQTYLELYFIKKDRAFIAPTIAWLDSGSPHTPTGAKVWYLDGGGVYADSLYVGAPALAMLGNATGDGRYVGWMNAFFWDIYDKIFDPPSGLFYRDARFIGKRDENGRKIIWARANGWVLASLPRILTYLPAGDPDRGRYEALFRRMCAAIAERQQPDGLWRTNLDDAAEFPMPETSSTGFFCYGMAWGIRQGLLDRASFRPVVERAWIGLTGCVSPEGKVQWGQGPADQPESVKQEETQEYVAGAFLLAGSEIIRLSESGAPLGGKAR